MSDYTSLENLYRKGILEYNPKDFINGTNSNVVPEVNNDYFLPDNRFTRVDGSYIRGQIDRDMFEMNSDSDLINPGGVTYSPDKKDNWQQKLKNIITSKAAAGITAILALLLSGRYILKRLHIIK